MTNDDLREEYILEAQKAFDCSLDVSQDTEITMIGSNGFTAWTIAPLRVIGPLGSVIKTFDEQAILSVEDAGESQRRFILLILDDEPFMLVHTYFMDDVQTFEISGLGRVNKPTYLRG